ncbi:MAG: FHA domain-containing protein [Deltaproteobacteria bacterium]|nr:FHA domain-containing protein [Deltaproteobacteria bacterium]
MFKLVIQDDEGKTTVVPLIRDEITIGRKEGNTIRLTERNVSRRHARILRNNGEVQIEDLGSYNGIRVNNARIAERVALRVSDQVQIGDYKLYLKAEGVEQVDDARTMPIERVSDSSIPATESMAAVTAPGNGTPTLPMGVPQTIGSGAVTAPTAVSGLASASLVGNPNRTLVAIADTDPAGRPVANAAAVAALTAPVGYGKLVVLSSNFAGKEFELSRPQMIIGRTDENDIVVNHRSISRNHAKLVREPETGRYTISDLQSSNGVRVNGQDYGKVELRRGDVVDLGHVRLRFVDAGEDFVFARDAVITDVPDVGGKKGLLVAVVLGVVLLGGIGVFFAMKGGEGDDKKTLGNDVVQPAGSGTGGGIEGSGSNDVVAVGSDVAVKANPAVEVDAGSATTNNGSNTATTNTAASAADELRLECSKASADRKWADVISCSERFAAVDPAKAKELRTTAVAEAKAETAQRNLETALSAKNYVKARTELNRIPDDSVYRKAAESRFDGVVTKIENDFLDKARAATTERACKSIQREATTKGVGAKANEHRCPTDAVAAVKNPNTNPNPNPNPGPGSGNAMTVAKPDCDADALRAKGDDHLGTGMDAAALAAFEKSMACRPDPGLVRKAYMAACRSKNTAKAKQYFGRLPASMQGSLAQICIRVGIQVP